MHNFLSVSSRPYGLTDFDDNFFDRPCGPIVHLTLIFLVWLASWKKIFYNFHKVPGFFVGMFLVSWNNNSTDFDDYFFKIRLCDLFFNVSSRHLGKNILFFEWIKRFTFRTFCQSVRIRLICMFTNRAHHGWIFTFTNNIYKQWELTKLSIDISRRFTALVM